MTNGFILNICNISRYLIFIAWFLSACSIYVLIRSMVKKTNNDAEEPIHRKVMLIGSAISVILVLLDCFVFLPEGDYKIKAELYNEGSTYSLPCDATLYFNDGEYRYSITRAYFPNGGYLFFGEFGVDDDSIWIEVPHSAYLVDQREREWEASIRKDAFKRDYCVSEYKIPCLRRDVFSVIFCLAGAGSQFIVERKYRDAQNGG